MAQKCVHKGCGKSFSDPEEPCVYHPGPPEFHEGQKGWKCCKPRVLTFDEFLEISPCTTGKHSSVDDTPVPPPASVPTENDVPKPKPVASQASSTEMPSRPLAPAQVPSPSRSPAPPPESESDDPSLSIAPNTTCRRRGCNKTYNESSPRDQEECVHHPGQPLFHEGSKGWTCCKRKVLEFDEFMKIEGCNKKQRHLFVGKGKKGGEEKVDTVRDDFYQTPTTVITSLYLKKIDKSKAKIHFLGDRIEFDLPTSDNKRYIKTWQLFAPIIPEKTTYRILGTKLELTLAKADGRSWPVLRSDDPRTGEILQIGKAARA